MTVPWPYEIFDVEKLDRLRNDGYVTRQPHPSGEAFVWNYTPKTQFEKRWTPETLSCRGLVLDEWGNVLSRPLPKFFNLEEHGDGALPADRPDLYEKLDGSLIVASKRPDGTVLVNSRGSFQSVQATWARAILDEVYGDHWMALNRTYVFELIHPQNRIVVDYGDENDLVLLASIHTPNGEEPPVLRWGAGGWTGPVAETLPIWPGSLAEAQRLNTPNAEGFVARWRNGFRVKLKFADYVRLHKAMTGITARDIWEFMRRPGPSNRTFNDLVGDVPDEMYEWVLQTADEIHADWLRVERAVYDAYAEITVGEASGGQMDRADFARAVAQHPLPHKQLLFLMRDGRDYADAIFKLIKPAASRPFSGGLAAQEAA